MEQHPPDRRREKLNKRKARREKTGEKKIERGATVSEREIRVLVSFAKYMRFYFFI